MAHIKLDVTQILYGTDIVHIWQIRICPIHGNFICATHRLYIWTISVPDTGFVWSPNKNWASIS